MNIFCYEWVCDEGGLLQARGHGEHSWAMTPTFFVPLPNFIALRIFFKKYNKNKNISPVKMSLTPKL